MKLIVVIALLITAQAAAFPQAARGPAGRNHPVEEFFMSGIRAFNAHDLDEFMKQFADDLEMYTAERGWLRGKRAVRERFVWTFQNYPSVRMEIEDLRVREVARGRARRGRG